MTATSTCWWFWNALLLQLATILDDFETKFEIGVANRGVFRGGFEFGKSCTCEQALWYDNGKYKVIQTRSITTQLNRWTKWCAIMIKSINKVFKHQTVIHSLVSSSSSSSGATLRSCTHNTGKWETNNTRARIQQNNRPASSRTHTSAQIITFVEFYTTHCRWIETQTHTQHKWDGSDSKLFDTK